jgi:hypothetical protein
MSFGHTHENTARNALRGDPGTTRTVFARTVERCTS